jgi:hypothetical protein
VVDEVEFDEFEAMEAEAEALAASAKNPKSMKQAPPIRAIVKPGQPNPNVVRQPQQAGRPMAPPRAQAPPPQPQAQQQEIQQLWVAFTQPEVVGLVNTQTGEKMESSREDYVLLMAQAMARMLNDLNTVIIAGGFE